MSNDFSAAGSMPRVRGDDLDPEAYLNDRSHSDELSEAEIPNQALTIDAPSNEDVDTLKENDPETETTFHTFDHPRMTVLDLDQMQTQLTLPADQDVSHTFEEVSKCIETVDHALQGTNWRMALDHLTKLTFTILIIAFIMARRAHPDFPSLADWGVIARMRGPFLRDRCLYENPRRKTGEPRWSPRCFPDSQLMLGTGVDHGTLYIKNSNDTWTRLKMLVSEDINKWITGQLEREQTSELQTNKFNTEMWDEVAKIVRTE